MICIKYIYINPAVKILPIKFYSITSISISHGYCNIWNWLPGWLQWPKPSPAYFRPAPQIFTPIVDISPFNSFGSPLSPIQGKIRFIWWIFPPELTRTTNSKSLWELNEVMLFENVPAKNISYWRYEELQAQNMPDKIAITVACIIWTPCFW